ncbi:hypothetical protein T01_11994 [Trichinella spiralis]|uniref:Uncharacterized protein n=1 Tax=Trichinella spiralis TaxID=6334 RepID=A0A0V1AK34_TRISP|nr:hypothetical protein T01_11994 [Trichinella spiralis]
MFFQYLDFFKNLYNFLLMKGCYPSVTVFEAPEWLRFSAHDAFLASNFFDFY